MATRLRVRSLTPDHDSAARVPGAAGPQQGIITPATSTLYAYSYRLRVIAGETWARRGRVVVALCAAPHVLRIA